MATIGVVVFSLAGMRALTPCLESVQWADSVWIVHVGEGKPEFNASLSCPTEVRQLTLLREFDSLRTEWKTDWVLSLWGEERVGSGLREELVRLRNDPGGSPLPPYRIPLRSRVLNRWVQGSLWGPTPSQRLSSGEGKLLLGWWDGRNFLGNREGGLLRGAIEDYSLDRLSRGLSLLNDVSRLWAGRLIEQNQIPGAWKGVWRSLCIFLRHLWNNKNLNLSAWALSILAAYGCLLTVAKVWEGTNWRTGEARKT